MRRTVRAALAAFIVASALILGRPLAAAAPTSKPEDVGLSTERLKRVAELVQQHVTGRRQPGAQHWYELTHFVIPTTNNGYSTLTRSG